VKDLTEEREGRADIRSVDRMVEPRRASKIGGGRRATEAQKRKGLALRRGPGIGAACRAVWKDPDFRWIQAVGSGCVSLLPMMARAYPILLERASRVRPAAAARAGALYWSPPGGMSFPLR
jgi:hypothetical protein